MKKIIIIYLLFINFSCLAQKATVSGRILENNSKEEMMFVEISLSSLDEKQTTLHLITDEMGRFTFENVTFGNYNLTIKYFGYQTITKTFKFNLLQQDLGDFYLSTDAEELNEIIIDGRKAAFSYQVDRKTINAAAFPEATNAIDLLTNVPSLQVSVDGKVTYREGGTFVVYINGIIAKDGQERLRTLEASQIEKIDIITNPSAKYSASGTAGIIRVVLKKNKLEGYAINLTTDFNTLGHKQFSYSIDKKGLDSTNKCNF